MGTINVRFTDLMSHCSCEFKTMKLDGKKSRSFLVKTKSTLDRREDVLRLKLNVFSGSRDCCVRIFVPLFIQ